MKKLFAVTLAVCMIFALCACSGSGDEAGTNEAEFLTQVVSVDMFGTPVEVSFTQDAAGTQYMFSYSFAGNDIEASGEIVDGVYTLTDDPSGFAKDAEASIYAALTSEWTGDNGDAVTLEPAAAPAAEAQATVLTQVASVDMFGTPVEVTFTQSAEGTQFSFSYNFAGNDIEASGEIVDGVYTLTDDPSGFAKDAAAGIYAALTSEWTGDNGEAVTLEPAAAPAN